MDLRLGLVVLALYAGSTIAGPIQNSRTSCAKQCSDTSKYSYQPGVTYTYTYNGGVITKVNGATEDSSGLHITSTVDIEIITSCEFALKLRDVTINEVDGSGRSMPLEGTTVFHQALTENSLRFSFEDGRIEEVCPVESEARWITNIKRGILSSFQNSMEDLKTSTKKEETDVVGRCTAEYKIKEKGWSSVTIDRSKDLLACTDRHGYRTAFQATPYRVASEIQSLPLMRSTHNCQQTFHTEGYLTRVVCNETHIFRPFSKEDNGATTEAKHSLIYQTERTGVSTSLNSNIRHSDLLYEHEEKHLSSSSDVTGAQTALQNICRQTRMDIRPETPKLFSELVYQLKELDTVTLRSLHRSIQSNKVCSNNHHSAKKYFHDAIPMTGTIASVALISDLVRSRHVRDNDAEMWLTSLAFIQSPKSEMITSVKELLTSSIVSQSNYLSSSALINKYCKSNKNCHNEESVREIAEHLESNLRSNCRVNNREHQKVILSLKALANMGVVPQVSQTLTRCATEDNVIDIRLAAIDALRRQPCEAERKTILSIFTNKEVDDEVRIAAYLAAMQCANQEIVNTVKTTLESETANQVGSFIWTHLTNLMETKDPHKQQIRSILENVYLKKEFDMDRRKFSRNYEGSVFLDSINTGAKVEGNIIWSKKSFVPRSAMMNMTVDLFGHSVNLLELGGRVEGMETLLETFFGPNGYFPENNFLKTLTRNKRQVASHKLDGVDRSYNGKANQDDIKASMYMKIFGNELRYVDLQSMTSGANFNILEILIKLAQNHEVNFSKSIMFLDTTITIPTIIGLPLQLSINGTATININLNGKMDIRRLHPSPRTMDIDGSIKSSAAIQFSSLMSIDAFVARTGLRMVTTMHSSTEIDGKIQIQDSKVVTINLNMPRQQQEILSVDNKFYIVQNSQEKEQKMITDDRVEVRHCTGDNLINILGIELCGEVSYPVAASMRKAPFYPLTGPSRIAIVLNKKDSHSGYQFQAKLLTNKERRNGKTEYSHIAHVAFNTPGSQVDRKLLFDFQLKGGQKALTLTVNTPWKKVSLDGSIVNEAGLKRASLRLNLDETQDYSITTELLVEKKPTGMIIFPNINIKMPHSDAITLTGNIAYKYHSSLKFNINANQIFSSPVSLSGSSTFDRKTGRLNADLNVESPVVSANLDGYLEIKDGTHRSRFNINYRLPQQTKESLTLHYKLRNTRTASLRKISLDTGLQNTLYPEYNAKMRLELEKTRTHAETTLDFQHGSNFDDPYRHLKASIITNYMMGSGRFKGDATISMSYPAKNVDFDASVEHNHDYNRLASRVGVTYTRGKRAEFRIDLNNLSSELLRMSADLNLKYPGRTMFYRQAIQEIQRNEYRHNMELQWQTDRSIKTTDVFRKDGYFYTLESTISYPYGQPFTVKGAMNLNLRDMKLAAFVERAGLKYGGEVSLSHNYRNGDLTAEATIDGQYPHRRVIAIGKIGHRARNSNLNLVLKWDADRDASKMLSLSGNYNYLRYHNTLKLGGRFTVTLPQRTAEILVDVSRSNGKCNSRVEVEWDSGKRMSITTEAINVIQQGKQEVFGTVKFTSPFKPVEELAGSLSYTKREQLHTAKIGVTWAPGKTIDMEAAAQIRGLGIIEFSGKLSTPFTSCKQSSVAYRHRVESDGIGFLVSGQLNEHHTDLEFSAGWRNKIEGSFKFRFPTVAHSLSGTFEHEREGKGQNINLKAVWDEKMSYEIKARVIPNGAADIFANVLVLTPHNNFKRSLVSYRHSITSRKMESNIQLVFAEKEIKFTLNTENKSYRRSRDIEVKIELITPFEVIRLGKLSAKHIDNGQRFETNVETTYNAYNIGSRMIMNYSPAERTNNGKLTVTTPFTGFRRMTYTWNHRVNQDFESSNEVIIDDRRYLIKLTNNHLLNVNGRTITSQLNVETPHELVRSLIVNGKYQNTYGQIETSINVIHNGNTMTGLLQLTGSIINRLTCIVNLDFGTFPVAVYIRPISGSLIYDARTRPHTIRSTFRFGENQVVRADASMDMRGANFVSASVNVVSPFEIAKQFNALMKYEKNGLTYTTRFSVSRNNQQVITSTGSYTEGIDQKGEIQIVTPYMYLENLSFNFANKEEHENSFVHTNKISYQFQGQKITLDSGCTFYGIRYINVYARISTPLEKLSSVGFRFTTKEQAGTHTSELKIELEPGRKTEITSNFKMYPLEMDLNVKTPYTTLSSLKAGLKHEGRYPYTTTQASIDLTVNDIPFSAITSWEMQTWNLFSGRVNVNDASLEMTHGMNGDIAVTKLTGKKAERSMMAETKLRMDGSMPLFKVNINTPFEQLQLLQLYVNCERSSRSCSGHIESRIFENSRSMDVSLTENNGRASIKITSSLFSPMDIDISYGASWEGKTHISTIQGTVNNKQVSFKTRFQNEGQYLVQMDLITPFDVLQKLTFIGTYQGRHPIATSMLHAEWVGVDRTASGSINFDMKTFNDISGSIKLVVPVQDYDKMEMVFSNKKEGKQWLTSVVGRIGTSETKVTFGLQSEDKLMLKFKLNTPFYLLNGLKFEFDYAGHASQFEQKLVFEYDASISRIYHEASWSVNGFDSIRGSARTTTPFKNLEYTGYSVNHVRRGKVWETDVTIEYAPGRRIELKNILSLADGISLDTLFTSSLESLRKASLNLSHNGNMRNMKTVVKIDYNNEYIFNGDLKVQGLGFVVGLVRIAAPQISPITIKFNQDLTEDNFETSGSVEFNNDQKITATGNIVTGDEVEWTFTLKTTFDALSLIQYNSVHSGRWPSISSTMTGEVVTFNDQLTLRTGYKVDTFNKWSMNYHLTSSFTGFEDLSCIISHNKQPNMLDSSITVGIAKSQIIRLWSKAVNGETKTIEFGLTTPMENFRELGLIITHRGDLSDFVNSVDVTMNELQAFSSKWSGNGYRLIRGKIVNAILQPLTITFNHEQTGVMWSTNLQVTSKQREILKVNSDLKLDNDKSYKVNIASKCMYFRSLSADFEISGDMKRQGEIKAKFSHNLLADKITGSFKWKLENDKIAELVITTPFTENIRATIRQTLDGNVCKTSAQASYGTYEYDLNLKAAIKPNVQLILTIKTPHKITKEIKLKVNHQRFDNSMSASASLVVNDYPLSIFGNLKMEDEINGKITVSTPISNFETMFVEFSHSGDLRRFNTKATVQYMSNMKIEVIINHDVQSNAIILKTPFNNFEELSCRINYSGNVDQFKVNTALQYMTNSKIEVDIDFTSGLRRSLSIRLRTPFQSFEDIRSSVVHAAGKFQSNMQYMTGKNVELTMNYSPERQGLVLKTPFTNYENLKVEFSHSKSLHNFRGDLSFEYRQNEKIEAKINIHTRDTISAEASLNTPFKNFENTFIKVHHTSNQDKLTTNATVQYMTGKKIEGTMELITRNKIHCKVGVKTPFTNFKNIMASFHHVGSAKDFQSTATVQYTSMKKIEAIVALNLVSKIAASVQVITPFRNFENSKASFSLTGDLKEFQSSATLLYALSKKIETIVAFSSSRMEASVDIKTPFQDFENMNIKIGHIGDATAFRSNVVIQYMRGMKVTYSIDFTTILKYALVVRLQTPFENFESMSLELSHEGTATRFTTNADIRYMRSQSINGLVNFVFENIQRPTVDLKINLKTPFKNMRETELTYHHEGIMSSFNCKLNFVYGRRETIATNLVFKKASNITGSLLITTPFENFERTEFSFSHQGNLRRFITEAKLKFQRGKETGFKIDSIVYGMSRVIITATVYTPVPNFESMTINLSHILTPRSMRSSLVYLDHANRKVEILGEFNRSPLAGTFKIVSPIGAVTLTHSGNLSRLQSIATSTYGSETVNMKLSFTESRSNLEINLETPWAEMSLMHNGPLTDFKTSGMLTILGRKVTSEVGFRLAPVVAFNAQVTSPWFISAVNHNGNLQNFQSTASGSYGSNHAKIEVNVNLGRKVGADVKFTSSFPNFHLLSAKVTHNGDSRQFNTNAEVHWSRTQHIKVILDFNREGRRINANLKIETPFDNFQNIDMNLFHNGHRRAFDSSIKVQFLTNKKIQLSIHYVHQKEGHIILKTPYTFAEEWKLSFVRVKINNNNGYTLNCRWAPGQEIQLKIAGKFNGNVKDASLEGYLELATPNGDFRNLIIDAKHRHKSGLLRSALQTSYNHDDILKINIEMSIENGKTRFLANMAHPLPVQFILNLVATNWEKQADVEVSWHEGHQDTKMKVTVNRKDENSYTTTSRTHTFTLALPTRVVVVISRLEKTRSETKCSGSFIWDQAKNKYVTLETSYADKSRGWNNLQESSIKLITPLRTILGTLSHNRSGKTYLTEAELTLDLERKPLNKLVVVVETELKTNQLKTKLIIRPPRTHEITLRHTTLYMTDDVILRSQNELTYSSRPEDKFTVALNILDARGGRHHNYSATWTLTHPVSNIDMSLAGHYGASYRTKSAGILMTHLLASNVKRTFHILAELDSYLNQAKLMVYTPLKRLDVRGRMTKDRHGYKFDQESTIDGSNRIHSILDINVRNASVNLNVHYDGANPNKAFRAICWYLPNEITIKAYQIDGPQSIMYGLMSVHLNSSRVLHTRLHWKPTIIREVDELTKNRLVEINNIVRNGIVTIQSSINNEIKERMKTLPNTLLDVSSGLNIFKQEAASFKADGNHVIQAFETMFKNNEFYMKDTKETYTKINKYLRELTRVMKFEARRHMAEWSRRIQHRIAFMRRQFNDIMSQVEEGIAAIVLKSRPAWQSYAYSLIRATENTNRYFSNQWEMFTESAQERRVSFVKYFDDRFDYISYKMEPFINRWISLPKNLFSTRQRHFYERYQMAFNNYIDAIRFRFEDLKLDVENRLLIVRDDIKVQVLEITDSLLGHRYAQFVINYGSQAYNSVVELWEAWGIRKSLENVMQSLSNQMRTCVIEYAKWVAQKYMRIEKTGFTVYDPKNGEIQGEIYLPLEMKRLDRIPKFNIQKIKTALLQLKEKLMPTSDYSLWDTYYNYKPYANMLDWIPPFRAHAILARGKHFTTFDGTRFDFSGTCSYILARDFIDGNFTVIANFNNGRISSIQTITNDKSVEIFPDFKVTIDDHRVELPIQYLNTTVMRIGYNIRVHNTKGITVNCDLYSSICTANVTGWYFGKTAGLFGTYNNEQNDDLLTADRRVVTDINEFTRSWEIGSSCAGSRNLARVRPTTFNKEIQKICNKYFVSQKSIYRKCYSQVSPQMYMDMCTSDLQQDYTRRTMQEKVCDLTAAYVAECKLKEVDVRQAMECVKCLKPDGKTYNEGQTTTIQNSNNPNKKADVVFLIEEKPCNIDLVSRLETIANYIDNSLKSRGMTNTHFSVLGFGGRGVFDPVHSHTMEGQLFNEARKLRLAINSLDFSLEGSNTDVLDAIHQATKLPFRTGASKSVVVIPCSKCTAQSVGYAAMQQVLSESDIKLHMLMAHDFTLRTSSPKTNYLFGIDHNAAFTMHNINQRELTGDSILFKQVIQPKSLCSALALSRNGSVFNREKLLQGRSKSQKSFIDIFSRRIAKTAYPVECQICDCVVDEDGVGKSMCRNCEMPTYNSFLKKIFPPRYNQDPHESYTGNKQEYTTIPIPVPRNIQYEVIQGSVTR